MGLILEFLRSSIVKVKFWDCLMAARPDRYTQRSSRDDPDIDNFRGVRPKAGKTPPAAPTPTTPTYHTCICFIHS